MQSPLAEIVPAPVKFFAWIQTEPPAHFPASTLSAATRPLQFKVAFDFEFKRATGPKRTVISATGRSQSGRR